jgi:hypothetical protein
VRAQTHAQTVHYLVLLVREVADGHLNERWEKWGKVVRTIHPWCKKHPYFSPAKEDRKKSTQTEK